jgi:polyhydroxyalkanoate synthesis regulator phasin
MAEKVKVSGPPAPVAPPVPATVVAGVAGANGGPPVPPKRSPGHRGADVKDTVAEMAAKAHEISLEAGSKMAAAMKDVVNAAAGLTGFVLESARDLVQYMVRRGQMTQEEADKLIREAEEFQSKRKGSSRGAVSHKSTDKKHAAPAARHAASKKPAHSAAKKSKPKKPAKPAKKSKPAKAAKRPAKAARRK